MRTISEEKLTGNERKISSEIFRGSDGKYLISDGKTPALGPDTAVGECEMLKGHL